MKWRGGNELRDQSGGGQRAGLEQRLKDFAYPWPKKSVLQCYIRFPRSGLPARSKWP